MKLITTEFESLITLTISNFSFSLRTTINNHAIKQTTQQHGINIISWNFFDSVTSSLIVLPICVTYYYLGIFEFVV